MEAGAALRVPRMLPLELANQLRQAVAEALPRLGAITDAAASQAPAPGAWSRKQELGHLVDSSTHNEVRFVGATLEGGFSGRSYDQAGWVEVHGYGEMPWTDLIELCRLRKGLLGRVIERIPEAALGAECVIGGGPPVTLGVLVEDYIRHLRGHLDHIARV
jgi:hypothetical protein